MPKRRGRSTLRKITKTRSRLRNNAPKRYSRRTRSTIDRKNKEKLDTITRTDQKDSNHGSNDNENLVTSCLTKLKNVFSPNSYNSDEKTNYNHQGDLAQHAAHLKSPSPEPYKMSIRPSTNLVNDRTKTTPVHNLQTKMDRASKEYAFNVLSAAIEYGLRNEVVEKRGEFFKFKTPLEKHRLPRHATPYTDKEPCCCCGRMDQFKKCETNDDRKYVMNNFQSERRRRENSSSGSNSSSYKSN